VPSYLHLRDAAVHVPGLGDVLVDVAFGGNFYALLPTRSVRLEVTPALAGRLVATGLAVMDAVNSQLEFTHPENPGIRGCRHVVFTEPPGPGGQPARAAVAIHPGWLDRSPCGTGTSARMAALAARGELGLDEDFVHGSLIGRSFTGRLVGRTSVGGFAAVIPTVRGSAWLTGIGHYLLDPDDPFPAGFRVG
jgi:proline racemase